MPISSSNAQHATFVRWFALLSLLWRSAGWSTVFFGAAIFVQASMPTLLTLVTGALVHAVPAAVTHGLTSGAGRPALLALVLFIGGILISAIAGNLSQPLSQFIGSQLWLEVQKTCSEACLDHTNLSALEDPGFESQLHGLKEAERRGVLKRTPMMLGAVAVFRMVGGGALVLLLGFRWWAPLVLGFAWHITNLVFLRAMKKGLDVDVSDSATHQRRAEYLRSLVLEAPAAKEIRIFGLNDWMVKRYAEGWSHALELMWSNRTGGWLALAATLALIAAHSAVLGALVVAARTGQLDAARLVVFVQAVLASCALGLVGEPQWWLAQSLAMADELQKLRSRLPTATKPPPHYDVTQAKHTTPGVTVRFDRVRFTYPGRQSPILNDLTLDIVAGQSLGLVGVNGVGKSTLIKLLCGLYEPDSGRIAIDSMSPQECIGRIGVIFQDFVRYKLPLRENVGFGHLSSLHDQAMLDQVLEAAGGEDLLRKLPKGWDTMLSREFTDGVDLSGGEWQRVALARALIAIHGGAGLLILDEPTASLDVRAEANLFDRFLTLTEGVTTILVSHRLSSVRRANRIVVLDRGRVIEDGSHDELMSQDGAYATMFKLQASRFSAPSSESLSFVEEAACD